MQSLDAQRPEPGLIGLVGGMSWESTALYYARLNRLVQRRLGGHHNARSVLVTLDFEDLTSRAGHNDWQGIAAAVSAAAMTTERAGAAFVMITAMTGHAVADAVADAISVPLLHAADVLARNATANGIGRLGLLGTSTTLTGSFLTSKLVASDVKPVIPETDQRGRIDRIIFEELTHGTVTETARREVLAIVKSLKDNGADAIALACTELPMLFPEGSGAPVFIDLIDLHVEAAVDWALDGLPALDTA